MGEMHKKSEYYTLQGYRSKSTAILTEAMEDYLEMIYRESRNSSSIRINQLATSLNVKPSSVTKMIHKLQEKNLVNFEKYGTIQLTEQGEMTGCYLLWRHDVLVHFFKNLNGDHYHLEQVEKIEHFIDDITLANLAKQLKN